MKAHAISLGIGAAFIIGCEAAGYRLDGLSWVAGGLYVFLAEAIHEAYGRGRRG